MWQQWESCIAILKYHSCYEIPWSSSKGHAISDVEVLSESLLVNLQSWTGQWVNPRLLLMINICLADTFHKPGLKMHSKILYHLISVVNGNVIKAPLWDSAAQGNLPDDNIKYVKQEMTQLLITSFPNMQPVQIEVKSFTSVHHFKQPLLSPCFFAYWISRILKAISAICCSGLCSWWDLKPSRATTWSACDITLQYKEDMDNVSLWCCIT